MGFGGSASKRGERAINSFAFCFGGDDVETTREYPKDLNAWVHWAVTYDQPTGMRAIYRNGEQEAIIGTGCRRR